jgi:hypothetical protein
VVVGDVFGGSRGDEDVDEVQSGKGSSGVWSASSITSSGEGEKWPEDAQTPVVFGRARMR